MWKIHFDEGGAYLKKACAAVPKHHTPKRMNNIHNVFSRAGRDAETIGSNDSAPVVVQTEDFAGRPFCRRDGS